MSACHAVYPLQLCRNDPEAFYTENFPIGFGGIFALGNDHKTHSEIYIKFKRLRVSK